MPDVLLDRSHELPAGARVRLRLPRLADRDCVGPLLERLGVGVRDDMEARRLLRSVPGRRLAMCATTWHEGSELLVGLAAADLVEGSSTIMADEVLAPGVGELLSRALVEHAAAWRRRVA